MKCLETETTWHSQSSLRMFEEGVKLERCFLELGETEETEIEKKVGMKTNDLIKEVDQIITFLKALTDDVGLRVNKLLAQVDNMVAPLTNTVIKLEEVAEHLTLFREIDTEIP